MVKVCGVCKKFWNGIDTRSFHSFPVNEELKKKWIETLGIDESISKVSKCFYICSDHFDKKSYSDTQTTKRLRKDALPINTNVPESSSEGFQTSNTPSSSLSYNQEIFFDSCQKEDFCNKYPSASLAFRPIISRQRKQFPDSKLPATLNSSGEIVIGLSISNKKSDKSTKSGITEIYSDSLLFDDSLDGNDHASAHDQDKEGMPKPTRRTYKPLKKRRCWNSSTPNLPRKLFVSDAAYQNFLTYALSRRKIAKYKSQNLTKRIKNRLKKIEQLKAQAAKLKEERKESREDEYQRLPPIIADILSRMENKRRDYTSFMQAFVKSIHGSSPSTYELIRKKYLNCLPHPNCILNWKKPKSACLTENSTDMETITK